MKRVRPLHAVSLFVLFGLAVLGANYLLEGGSAQGAFEQVAPDRQGQVRIGIADLGKSQARFFRFLNPGNQEVRFFVGRDRHGVVQVAFDGNELCARWKRGYRHQGDWLVCNKCDRSFHLEEVNAGGGGCKPVPLKHRLEGDELVLTEGQILEGWRLFR